MTVHYLNLDLYTGRLLRSMVVPWTEQVDRLVRKGHKSQSFPLAGYGFVTGRSLAGDMEVPIISITVKVIPRRHWPPEQDESWYRELLAQLTDPQRQELRALVDDG